MFAITFVGVPVEHSRKMARLLEDQGYPHTYTEVPRAGHGCRTDEIWEQVVPWLLDQRKERRPWQVSLATYELRHNRAYWVGIEQLTTYGETGCVEAELTEKSTLDVVTEGVRVVALGPIPDVGELNVNIDGQALGSLDLSVGQMLQRGAGGVWQVGVADLSKQKRHAISGPISDLFHADLLLVPGTAGSDAETFFNQWIVDNARGYYSSRNGGVHRGGIMGHNAVELSSVSDGELDEERLAANNLLLYGNDDSNSVLARFIGDLPLRFADDCIELVGRTYAGLGVAVFAVFPHPLNPARYVAVHGGIAADAICWGSHLDMQLLPDYLVYAGGGGGGMGVLGE